MEMKPGYDPDQHIIKKLLKENNQLLKENHKLLGKMHRFAVWGFLFKILWYAVIIGLPFAIYFWLLEPWFAAFGTSIDEFQNGINQIPGVNLMQQFIDYVGGGEVATTSETAVE